MEFLNGLLNEYMIPIVIGICLCAGYIVKKWINDIDNKWIPTIVTGLGLFLAIWINGWVITPEAVLGGLASGLASTGMHQLFTQFIEKN